MCCAQNDIVPYFIIFEKFCTYMYSEQSIFSIDFFLKEACKMKYFLNGDADIF